ncbi:MAG TPA: hypothetical protein VLG44_08820 [Chlamydiales bacterium]|nr:hypothetical protein [Chlamydiales bacterium]
MAVSSVLPSSTQGIVRQSNCKKLTSVIKPIVYALCAISSAALIYQSSKRDWINGICSSIGSASVLPIWAALLVRNRFKCPISTSLVAVIGGIGSYIGSRGPYEVSEELWTKGIYFGLCAGAYTAVQISKQILTEFNHKPSHLTALGAIGAYLVTIGPCKDELDIFAVSFGCLASCYGLSQIISHIGSKICCRQAQVISVPQKPSAKPKTDAKPLEVSPQPKQELAKKPLFPVKPENFKSYVTQFEGKVKQRRTDLPIAAIWETLKDGYSKFLPGQKIALKAEYDKGERLFREYQASIAKPAPRTPAPVSAVKPKSDAAKALVKSAMPTKPILAAQKKA